MLSRKLEVARSKHGQLSPQTLWLHGAEIHWAPNKECDVGHTFPARAGAGKLGRFQEETISEIQDLVS